jgi:large subunit ribosomal protein L19
MESVAIKVSAQYKKSQVVDVRSGDTVKVHQRIREGNKERVQIFQGLVIRTDQKGTHLSRITVRRIASGVGVEKSFLLHSPLITKVEVTKRSKVRRNYLTYMRERTGKSARMTGTDFDRVAVNTVHDEVAEKAETEAKAKAAAAHDQEAAQKAQQQAKEEANAQAALAAHEQAAKSEPPADK